MSVDLFVGTSFTGAMDEDVRPFGHARDLRPFTGSYAIRMRCDMTLAAQTKKAARDHLRSQLEDRTILVKDATQAITITALGVTEGAPAARPIPHLEEPPSLDWLASRNDPQVRESILDLTNRFSGLLLTRPDKETNATTLAQFDARFSLTFQCARMLWARDESHARCLLDEDVAVLLTPASLDRWADDQIGLDTRILRVAEHVEEPS